MSIEQEESESVETNTEKNHTEQTGNGDSSQVMDESFSEVDGQVDDDQAGEAVEGEVLTPEMISMRQALDEARERLKSQEEDVLRERAEMQNVRRRTQKEVENARKFALESFVNELLPVVDGLERGLEAVPEDDDSQKIAREGMELTLKMLLDVLEKQNVLAVNPVNEPFNPDVHQAMSMQPSAEVAPNTVLSVMQKGFTLNGRVLRPALVMVSKKA